MTPDQHRVLLVGRDHNFDELGPILREALTGRDDLAVELTSDWDALRRENLTDVNAVVDYVVDYEGEMTAEQRRGLLSYVREGGGYVGLHGAAFHHPEGALVEEFESMLGGRLVGHPGVLKTTTEIIDSDHPITRGVSEFSFVDEPYELDYDDDVHVLATTDHESFGTMPVAWTKTYGDGRVFYYAAGHDERAFENEHFQRLIRRGIEWVAI